MKKYLFLYLIISRLLIGYINIYPPYFYEKLEKNKIFKEFVLSNTREFAVRYRLYVEDSISTSVNKDIKVEVYPKSITLKPFEKKSVKVLIQGDSNLNREFRKVLVIKEIELPRERKKMLTLFKLKLSGFSGNLKTKLQYKIKNGKLEVKNVGNRIGIYNLYNEKKEFLDSFILKEGEVRNIDFNDNILIFEEKFQGEEKIKRRNKE